MLTAPWPKRRETTFTSSGCETRSAMRLGDCAIEPLGIEKPRFLIARSPDRTIAKFYLLRSLLLIVVENPIHLLYRQVLVKIVIHLRRRSPAASSDALHFLQRKQPVLCRLLVPDPQLLRTMMQDFFSTADHAADIRAHLHVVFPSRLGGQHRVVADHVPH